MSTIQGEADHQWAMYNDHTEFDKSSKLNATNAHISSTASLRK